MALSVGDVAPDFKVSQTTGEAQGEFQLSAQKGKNVVVVFYPADFTPVCTNELAVIQQNLAKLSAAGAEVVGLSTDTVFSSQGVSKIARRAQFSSGHGPQALRRNREGLWGVSSRQAHGSLCE